MNADESKARARLASVIVNALDDDVTGASTFARKAAHSRSQFYRLFQALIDEQPGAMRRRLLLERAAWQLGRTRRPVTTIAFDAGFGSLEAFTRAFRKAFGVSPSLYRRMGATHTWLPATNGIHFSAPAADTKGATQSMDLFDLFAGTDSWYTRRLLEQAATLTDEQLDRPVQSGPKVFGWDQPDRNLREMLERMVQTKEVWTAALTNGPMPNLDSPAAEERAPRALLQRFEKAEADFHRILKAIRDRGAWDETFVDALCEPPETFTFGGMFAHVITFNGFRRLAALDALQRLGAGLKGFGCPMEYESSVAERTVLS